MAIMKPEVIPAVTIPDQFNAATLFVDRHLAEGRGAQPAIICEGATTTYAQLAELTNRVGNGLRALGVEMEQRVALLLADSPAFAASFFGAIKIGAVAVPINTALRPAELVYMLNDSRAKALLVHANLWPTMQEILPQLTALRHVVIVGQTPANAPKQRGGLFRRKAAPPAQTVATANGNASFHDFAAWTQAAAPDLAIAATSKDDSAFWLYSSGSTGFPKGCVHLQHDMVFCLEYYAKPILGITAQDRCFSASKLPFAYGLGNGLYFSLGVGASAVHFPGKATPEDVFKVVQEQRPTLFFTVPTLYGAMLAVPDAAQRFDFSSVRACVSAGEALPADILRRWQDTFHVDILDGIGSTEILHIFISNRPGDIRPGSTGKLVPGYDARIVDEQGQPVLTGELGSLQISGDSTLAYYWNKHEKTKDTIMGRWIATGDTYYQDADGYYWYAGRADDMLKVGGRWVSPAEVEAVLIEHPAVLESALIGSLDAQGLTKPKAFVVLKSDTTPSDALAEELRTLVATRLAPFKSPQWVTFVPDLPKTATGKIQRFALRANDTKN
jgi:benzoate-CoA ligase family protein